jgi:cytochrome c oxidase subunit 2
MNFLIIILSVLGLIALIQLVRVFEITGKLRGNNQDDIDFQENKLRGKLWLLFGIAYFGFFIWLAWEYGDDLLPVAASEHGAVIDNVLNFNWIILILAFVITHVLLFYFASKYYWKPNHKADFITHSTKLELIWTTFPAIVLAVIVIYGLSAWNDITDDAPEDSINIELYSKQFAWVARYAGQDNKLGEANYNFTGGSNQLGLITPETIKDRKSTLEDEVINIEAELANAPEGGAKEEELQENLDKKERQLAKIMTYERQNEVDPFVNADDDKIVNMEFHIPVNKPVNFQFRSQDVIHSAYMPHFRAQMNCVPGTKTRFHFTPTITTEDMREKTGNDEFNYLLYCNKICGAAHYNMQMTIVVESQEDYEKWLSEQSTFTSVETAQSREEEKEVSEEEVLAEKN